MAQIIIIWFLLAKRLFKQIFSKMIVVIFVDSALYLLKISGGG